MKFKFLYTLIISFIFSGAYAQTQMITGNIYDASNGKPLAGATIRFSARNGTTSDKNGNFKVDCKKYNSIIISFIGFVTDTVSIESCEYSFRVGLTPSKGNLNDIEITTISSDNKSPLSQPQSITKLGEVELKRSTGLFFDDIINLNVPGVTFERRAVNSGQQLTSGVMEAVQEEQEVLAVTSTGRDIKFT